MFKMKKIVLTVLAMAMVNLMGSVACASTPETTDYIIISREEYIQNFADSHNITYEEAEIIDMAENAKIWNDYIGRSNLLHPMKLIYNDYYEQAGAKIWYVIVEDSDGGFPKVTYGAQGKLIEDPHSKTFVKGSFNSEFVYTNNMFFSLGNYTLAVEDDSYDHVYLSLVCPVEIPVDSATSVGGEGKLIQAGFELSGTTYYRKVVYANHKEKL